MIKINFLAYFSLMLTCVYAYADLCSEIESVYQESKHGFVNWKGGYDSDLSEYDSRYKLQGATRCFIEIDDSSKDYTCEWHISTKELMYANYNAFVQQISACKINGINSKTRKRTFSDSDTNRIVTSDKVTTYYEYNDDIKLASSIMSIYSKRSGTYQYIIDFKLENWQ